jgi:hypothetical protein
MHSYTEKNNKMEEEMADNSGGIGLMGVLVGALIVVIIGGALLFGTGHLGQNTSSVKIELPKISGTK